MSTEENEDGPELEFNDPEDYHRAQRLKEIHQRRQRVHSVFEDIERGQRGNRHRAEQQKQKHELIDAVISYATELEPLMSQTGAKPELMDDVPWDNVVAYINKMGTWEEDGERHDATYALSLHVFRVLNNYLADVRPLIEEDDASEWDV